MPEPQSGHTPVGAPHTLLATARERELEREGIPMFLALKFPEPPDAAGGEPDPEGEQLAELLHHYREAFSPGGPDDAEPALIDVLQVMAIAHFTPPFSPRTEGRAAVTTRSLQQPPPSFTGHDEALRAGRFIRVVNYHNTPHADTAKIRAELRSLAESFDSVSLDDLDLFRATGRWHKDRPGVIPVFYEGYRNNAEVAAPLAEEAGLTAWFFVCTAFLDVPVAEQYDYANAHHIDLVREDRRGDRLAMTWDDVAELSTRHVVTPHTANHVEAASLHSGADLEREIFAPKRKMDEVTGQNAACTAFLRGTPFGANPRVDEAVRSAGYRYQFGNTMIQYVG